MKKITTAKSLNNRMLNKLRIEFVIIAMISLVIMQSIIIYISGSYIYNKMLKKSDILINEIYVFLCDVYATMFGYCTHKNIFKNPWPVVYKFLKMFSKIHRIPSPYLGKKRIIEGEKSYFLHFSPNLLPLSDTPPRDRP